MNSFGISSIVVRFLLVYGVLFAIYNPSGFSYWHWVFSASVDNGVGYGLIMLMTKIAAGLFLVVILLSFASVIYHGVGLFGIVILALLALPITIAIGALFIQLWGLAMIVLIGLGIFIFMGLVYSNLRYRLSAQVQPASHNPGRPSL
jgi:hypothetical protein